MKTKIHFYVIKIIVSICFIIALFHTGNITANATSLKIQGGTEDWINYDQNTYVITDSDLIGRYGLNFTGNINYSTEWIVGTNNGEPGGYSKSVTYNDLNFSQYRNLSSYQKGITQYYTKDNYGVGIITSFNSTQIQPNSSSAVIMPTANDSEIVRAYLIWYTRDSGNLFDYYNDPVYFVPPNGKSEWVYPEHACMDTRYGIDTLLCLSADVTDIVKSAGYGSYGVANIPFWYQTTADAAGCTGGGAVGSWQLVVVEESADFPVRAVKLEIFSGFLAGTTEADGNHQSIQTTSAISDTSW